MAEFDFRPISHEVVNFSVGFSHLVTRNGEEDALPAGSGTLVQLGPIAGVLTAAHVLEALPDRGEVGIVLTRGVKPQKQTIDMLYAQKVMIGAAPYGPCGPDIGFLRLPPLNVSNLRATNSFIDLGKRRNAVLTGTEPATPKFHAIVGDIAEWVEDLPEIKRPDRFKIFTTLANAGVIVKELHVDGYDLFYFEVKAEEGFEPTTSYEGTSGGSLWRVYVVHDERREQIASELRLLGVAFYQFKNEHEKRIIICHGPKSIYEDLIGKLCETWPDECAAALG